MMFTFLFCNCFRDYCREKRNVAKAKVRDGRRVLDQWKTCYFEVREVIEKSGRESRWEFDRKMLFERTDYMALVCQDFYDILQVRSPSENWSDIRITYIFSSLPSVK